MTTRRKFICDVVEKYKKDYPKEYEQFLDLMQWKRQQLADKKTAKMVNVKEIRLAASVPEKLLNQLTYVLNGIDEPLFLEDKAEMKWFVKKFPAFLIPNNY
jgi:hypothetical protein